MTNLLPLYPLNDGAHPLSFLIRRLLGDDARQRERAISPHLTIGEQLQSELHFLGWWRARARMRARALDARDAAARIDIDPLRVREVANEEEGHHGKESVALHPCTVDAPCSRT